MGKPLFGGGLDEGALPSNDKAVYLGPKRTVKVGGRLIEERLGPPPSSEDVVMDELLRGISDSDLRSAPSGFGRFCSTQAPVEGSSNFRGFPVSRRDNITPVSENYDSEAQPSSTGFEPGVSKIEFEPGDVYERPNKVRESLLDDEELGLEYGDITMEPGFEHSYARDESYDPDRERIEASRESTFQKHLAELNIFGEDEE